MNTPPNVYFLGGSGPQQQPPGHRPKRRRKNRDARKKDAEKKKEKEALEGWKAIKKAFLLITVFAPILIIPLSWSLVGLAKFTIVMQEWNVQMMRGVFK